MTMLPPGFGDPTGGAAVGVTPGLVQQLQQQPFVGWDLGILQQQQGFTDQQAQEAFQNATGRLGIQRGALGREQAALPQEHNLTNQLMGLSREDLGLQQQQLGLRSQSLDLTQQGEQQAADVARRGAWSSGTARGATNTQGFRQGLGDINTNLANQLAQLGLSRQGVGLQGQGLGIQGQRLGIEQQQSDLNYGLQQGSLADQLAGLNISGTEIGQSLQNSLQGAGINALTGGVNVMQGAFANSAAGAQAVPGQVAAGVPPGSLAPQAPQNVGPPPNIAPQPYLQKGRGPS